MKLISKLTLLGLAVSTAFACGNTQAAVSANASLVVTGFRLVDLDLNDGVTPDIIFHSIGNASYSVAGAVRSSSDIYQYNNIGDLLPNSSSVTLNGVSGAASYSGGAFGTLASRGRVEGEGNFRIAEYFNSAITLTAHTELILLGHGSASSVLEDGSFPGENQVVAVTSLSLRDNDLTQYVYFVQQGASFEQDFSLSYRNMNAQDSIGWLDTTASVDGLRMNTPLPADPNPVPEPQSWGLMLAGLAGLAWMVRRKNA
jgi:hypothetical protein